ncbi:hypothetical protein B7463_g4092, partial [Scytalidium lignicola]
MGFDLTALIRIPEQGRVPTPPEAFNWRFYVLVFFSSFGALCFGYDLAFIGGTFSLQSFISRFHLTAENSVSLKTNMVSTFFGGAFFGVILMYWFNEKFGRRLALILAGMVFNCGIIFQVACHGNVPAFYAGRIIAGLGVGGISFVVPQYLSECSPARARGAVVGCYEIFLQLGTVIGFWINYGVNLHVAPTDEQWHIPIAIQFIPGSVMALGLLFLCESPRWLYLRGRRSDAAKSLTWIRNLPEDHPYVRMELEDYERQMEHEKTIASGSSLKSLIRESFSKQIRRRIFVGCMLMIFQNSTGINAMNSYSVSFFAGLGFRGTTASLFSTGVYGAVKASVTIISFFFFIDRLGRRQLLFIGSIGVAFSLYYVSAYAGITNSFSTTRDPDAAARSAQAFIYIYGAAYAFGWNTAWVICSEIFPTRVRSFCLVFTTCSHWIGEFYTNYSAPYMLESITYGTMLFYASMTALGGVFVYFYVPETKGIPLEDMEFLWEVKGFAPQQMRAYRNLMLARVTEGIEQKVMDEEAIDMNVGKE